MGNIMPIPIDTAIRIKFFCGNAHSFTGIYLIWKHALSTISEGYYYVDKTLLIYDILTKKSKVTLFAHPRRFGKTLAQSMLHHIHQ